MEFGIWNLDPKFHQKQVTRRNTLIYLHFISLIISLELENLKQTICSLLTKKKESNRSTSCVFVLSLSDRLYLSHFSLSSFLPRIFLWTHVASLVLKIGGEEISLSLVSSFSHSLCFDKLEQPFSFSCYYRNEIIGSN